MQNDFAWSHDAEATQRTGMHVVANGFALCMYVQNGITGQHDDLVHMKMNLINSIIVLPGLEVSMKNDGTFNSIKVLRRRHKSDRKIIFFRWPAYLTMSLDYQKLERIWHTPAMSTGATSPENLHVDRTNSIPNFVFDRSQLSFCVSKIIAN